MPPPALCRSRQRESVSEEAEAEAEGESSEEGARREDEEISGGCSHPTLP